MGVFEAPVVGPMPGLQWAKGTLVEHRDLLANVLWPVSEDSLWLQTCEGIGRVHRRSVAAKGCPARLLGGTVIYFPV